MIISIRNVTKSGNNVHGYMYFDGHRVGELHVTPAEYFEFMQLLHAGNEAMGYESERIEIETPR